MAFDWLSFLRTHHIEYVESGPSVTKGNVAIRCPFCGGSDPSQHMGISTEGHGWGCWRNASHRGRNPARLIQALLRCSYPEAARLSGQKTISLSNDESLGEEMATLLNGEDKVTDTKPGLLKYSKNFRRVERGGFGYLFLRYLTDKRGYNEADAKELCGDYDLLYATQGAYAYRLIVPVYMPGVGLATWTGRAIDDRERIRYRSLTDDVEKAKAEGSDPALKNIKDCLWFSPETLKGQGGETLVVCEGPLDALRVDFFGRRDGLRATCLFSKTISRAQEELLGDLSVKFRRRLLLVDGDAKTDAFGLFNQLERFGFKYRLLPGDVDPAELSPKQIARLALRD